MPHRCVEVLHAVPVGQSVARLQPQAPLIQAEPIALPAQVTQAMPFEPQVVCAVPTLQVPALQQPPEHGEPGGEQLVVHWCAALHAPLAQSPATLQPHWPAMH
jgi:hypothetical protein